MRQIIRGLSHLVLLSAALHATASEKGLHVFYSNEANFDGTLVGNIVTSGTGANTGFNFNWSTGSPDPDIQNDTFCAAFTGHIMAPSDGTYTFHVTADDGARLWIGGKSIIPDTAWADTSGAVGVETGTIALKAGKRYDLRLFYYENTGSAQIKLEWTRPGQSTPVVLPFDRLFHNVTDYTDPWQQIGLTFGSESHWLQPWRAFLETVPASNFVKGVGAVFNAETAEAASVGKLLARYKTKHVRFEVGWGSFKYDDEDSLTPSALDKLTARLKACKENGLRPVICLNANHRDPCPLKTLPITIGKDADEEKDSITINGSPANLALIQANLRRVGLDAGGVAAGNMFVSYTPVSSTQAIVGLSKKLGAAIRFPYQLPVSLLKYRPLLNSGSDQTPTDADTIQALDGWSRYTKNVCTKVRELLYDPLNYVGYDVEVWNELTFGSNFINRKNYEPNAMPTNDGSNNVYQWLVDATVDELDKSTNSTIASGVEVSDGFGNTNPFPRPNIQPRRVTSIGGHPYPGFGILFNQNTVYTNPMLGAQGQPTTFRPTYSSRFPEFKMSGINGVGLMADFSPLMYVINSVQLQGRYSRLTGTPVGVRITEVQFAPNDSVDFGNPANDNDPAGLKRAFALHLKAKAASRYYSFMLNKGAKCVDLYSVSPADFSLGHVTEGFYNHLAANQGAYPSATALTDAEAIAQQMIDTQGRLNNPSPNVNWLVSPALLVASRMVGALQSGLDGGLSVVRAVGVDSVTDVHNSKVFLGTSNSSDSNERHLFNRDVMAVLPYQVNATKFAIPFYVMTRDLHEDSNPLTYKITLRGINLSGSSSTRLVEVYDPLKDSTVALSGSAVQASSSDKVVIEVSATDYAKILVIRE
jgi:hypothetical protein